MTWDGDSIEASGLLFPEAPGLARFGAGGRVQVTDVAQGFVFAADGVFGAEIIARLRGGGSGPTLTALGAGHPVVQSLQRMCGGASVELTATSALELDGYDTLFVELLGRCNESCVHCYASSNPAVSAALDRATCEAIVDDAAELGFRRVQFTGGDPLLCAFLPELVDQVVGRGIRCEVYTNGLALTDRLIERLARSRPAFALSFYSHDPATHDAITRTPGSQRRTTDAIVRIVERGLKIRAAMVVLNENAEHVAETVAFLRSLGVGHVSVGGSYAVGRGELYDGAIESAAGNVHRGPDNPAVRARHGKLCVTYAGDVVPCIFNREDVVGHIGARRLRDIARRPTRPPRRAQTSEDMLDECGNKLACVGCRLTACALQAIA